MPSDSCASDVGPLRLAGPADLVEIVPFLCGFTPSCSVVVVALQGSRRRVLLTLRADLADVRTAVGARTLLARARRAAGRDWPQLAVVVVVYPEHPPVQGARLLPHADVVERLRSVLDRHGVAVLDALCVAGERWWSYECDDPRCCPPEGRPSRADSPGPAVAGMVVAGRVALGCREELAAELLPADEPSRASTAAAVASSAARPGSDDPVPALRRLDRTLRADRPVTPAVAGRLLLALSDVRVRDAACTWLDGPRHDAAAALWVRLVTLAPPGRLAPPATLAALWAYSRGDGARANVAVQRALADRPGYRFAVLLDRALAGGLPPGDLVPAMQRAGSDTRRLLLGGSLRPV